MSYTKQIILDQKEIKKLRKINTELLKMLKKAQCYITKVEMRKSEKLTDFEKEMEQTIDKAEGKE